MKRLLLAMATIFAVACSNPKSEVAAEIAIIPQPLSLIQHENSFKIKSSTALVCEAEELAPLATYVQEYLVVKGAEQTPANNYISLALDKSLAEEEYSLSVSNESVKIVAGGYGGAFNGVQTLFQLLPSEVYTKQMSLPAEVQGCDVQDKPKFAYRGFMLDVVRTFMTKENVLRYIDYIAYHKINKLHWHLTDSQGWRVEIKSHPDLAKVAGFRGGDSPLRAALGKWNEKYGGYYTQEEIKEIVAYAAVRNIEVIPEIDLPGHSEALLRIYPEMLCNFAYEDMKVNGNYDSRNVICATKESNYVILEEILAEVCALFPSKHFHIGGDEVQLSQWLQCPDCSAWLKRKGYTDGYKLEDMFVGRIQAILAKYGKTPGVWNEAAFGGGLSKEALVYGWKSAEVCKQVMMKGYRTIFMPQEYFYFDMRQGKLEKGRTLSQGAFDFRKTYSFDFADQGFTPEEATLVEGFEAPFWSETSLMNGGDKTIDFIEYQTFPRLCALAEQGWGKNGGGEWQEFHNRLYTRHYDRMVDMGLNFRITPSNIKYENGLLSVEKIDNSKIYYRKEGSNRVCRYKKAISTDVPGQYRFWAEYRSVKSPEFAHASRYETLKPKVKFTSSMPESSNYPFSNVNSYDYNSVRTNRTCHKGDWALYEFEEPVECREIEFWIGTFGVSPRNKAHLEVSEDGVNFERVAQFNNGCARVINPRPIKSARIVIGETYIGDFAVRFTPPVIYPKW
jgi:hexosaminidase